MIHSWSQCLKMSIIPPPYTPIPSAPWTHMFSPNPPLPHTYIIESISHFKHYHASSSLEWIRRTSLVGDDSFTKCLWISQRDFCCSPGPEHMSRDCLNWPNCIDFTKLSCRWLIFVLNSLGNNPVFKVFSNDWRSAFSNSVAQRPTYTV